jgi:hypothetical protein
MTEMQSEAVHYRSTSIYPLMVGASALAALFCAWSLWVQFDWITLIFLFGCLYAAWSFGLQWRSTVALDAQGLSVRAPFQSQRVEYRQLDDAGEAGRLVRRIVVTYHPLRDNGLLDLDELRSVTLPAVDQQVELLALLESKRPQRG